MEEQIKKIDRFKLLLNDISRELTEQNLLSLIHFNAVPGSIRKNMTNGLKLFDFLITQNIISREKIVNLRHQMEKVKRKDLVLRVDKYIEKEFGPNKAREIFAGLSDSSEDGYTHKAESPVTVLPEEKPVCKIDCAYLGCVCRRVPSCYTPVIILLVLAIISTALFWYFEVPKITKDINSSSDLKNAGKYILLSEVLVLVIVLFVCFRRKCVAMCRACCKPEYSVLSSSSIQEEPRQQIVRSSSANSMLQKKRMASAPRAYKESESSESAYNSIDPSSSMSTIGTLDDPKSGGEGQTNSE